MNRLKKLKHLFLNYVVRDRKKPAQNRQHVGQNLMVLSIFIFFVFIINFVVIIGTDSKFGVDLSTQAAKSYNTKTTVAAKRGTIYDRNGNVLAEDSTSYSIYAIVSTSYVSATREKLYVQDSQFDKVADILKDKLGIEKSDALAQLRTKGAYQVSFGLKGKGITYSVKEDLEKTFKDAGIKGMAFEATTSRMYPNGTFASEFLGRAEAVENKKDGSYSLVGQPGLERSLNSLLNGNTLLGTETITKEAIDGKNIYTTLSAPLQTFLETQMDTFMEQTKGVNASATVVNAKTGEILATTQRPTYNSDTLEGQTKKGYDWVNRLYEAQYEPGSTMKVMLLSAAINNGSFNPNATYSNANGIKVDDVEINDWSINEGISTGRTMSFAQGFSYSSNVGMTMLEQDMGDKVWSNYLSLYKFGLPTRFGMVGESSGIVSRNSVNIAQSSFGQGISVTQVQMLRAFTAISNNGIMLEPQFIKQVADTNQGTVRTAKKEVIGKPVSKQSASETRNYMISVGTDPEFGTLYNKSEGSPIIQVGNYDVAVKSGTAQVADEKTGTYKVGTNETLNSVVAMVPSDDPEYIIYVTVQEPQTWDNNFFATVVNPVLEEAMSMGATLDASVSDGSGKTEETSYQTGDIIGKTPGETANTLRQNLIHPIVLGVGNKIEKVSVDAKADIKANEQILIMTNDFIELPDMYGWTKKNVETFAKWKGIKITYKGGKSGTVTKQSVTAGKALSKTKKITITLGD